MYNKTKRTFVILMLVALILAGCGTLVGRTYDTLGIAAITYDAGMSYAGDQYKAGNISEERKAEIIKLAKEYKLAVETGLNALRAYMIADLKAENTDTVELILSTAMDAVDVAREALEKYIRMEVD